MARWWVGTSGWSYAHWKTTFYPREVARQQWLRYYANLFGTVEINATFYRLQTPTTFARWVGQVDEGFLFAIKTSRYLTHIKRLQDREEGLRRLLDSTKPLGDKLGPLLVQLPDRFPPQPDRLGRFLAAIPPEVRVAVEVRDLRWVDDEVLAVLRRHEAALVWSDYPGSETAKLVTAPFLYLRRHGAAGPYVGHYPEEALAEMAGGVGEFAGDVYCYFNNDAEGAAPQDAARLLGIVDRLVEEKTRDRPGETQPPAATGW